MKRTSGIIRLYQCAFREHAEEIAKDDKIRQSISKGQFEAVKFALKDMLSEKEYEVIMLWFGIGDGKKWPREAIAFHLGITEERVGQIIAKSVRKLVANRAKLPCLFSSKDGEGQVKEIISQLNALHEEPIFKREAELTAQLRDFSHSPFTYSERAVNYFAGRNATDLDRVGLSVRAYNCLRRAGINTIADAIDYPKEEWAKIRNASEKILREVEQKFKALGLVNFKIL